MSDPASNVRDFPAARREAPALGMSIVMNMPGDRQATLQCFVASDASLEEQNALLDRMMRIGDRQKAKYELTALYDDLAKHQQTQSRFGEDFARTELEYRTGQAQRDEAKATLLQAIDDETKAGYGAHATSGRKSEYKLSGAHKQAVNVAQAGIHQLDEQTAKAKAERDRFVEHLDISRTRYAEEIERIEADIARRKAIVGA